MQDDPFVEVRLLALGESTPTTLFAFVEVFAAVGTAWAKITGETAKSPRMRVQVVARDTVPVRSPVGPLIAPDVTFEAAVHPADIVIVTDLDLSVGLGDVTRWDAEATWLRAQAEAGATSARSALDRSCWPPQAFSTGGRPPPTGRRRK
jgi:hypothetical protein